MSDRCSVLYRLVIVDVTYHLACCKEERSYAKVGCRVGVNNLSGDSAFSDRLYVTYTSVGLQCYRSEVVPCTLYSGPILLFAEETVVDTPQESIGEECCTAGLGPGACSLSSMLRVQ